MDRTFDDALTMLAAIVGRLDKQIGELAGDRTKRRQVTELRTERAAIQGALDELREGQEDPADDTDDVPPAVVELVGYLATGPTPPHPYAGTHPGGEPGHCRPCWFVGHLVAHPDRSCTDVGCIVDHDVVSGGPSAVPDPTATVRLPAAPPRALPDDLPPLPGSPTEISLS